MLASVAPSRAQRHTHAFGLLLDCPVSHPSQLTFYYKRKIGGGSWRNVNVTYDDDTETSVIVDAVYRELHLLAEHVTPDRVELTLDGQDAPLDTRGLLKDSVFVETKQSVFVSWTGARSIARHGNLWDDV